MLPRTSMETRVAIVGGGPAGLLLSHMLHTFSGPDAQFDHNVQLGQLAQLVGSTHAKAHLAEFYTGLPITR